MPWIMDSCIKLLYYLHIGFGKEDNPRDIPRLQCIFMDKAITWILTQ